MFASSGVAGVANGGGSGLSADTLLNYGGGEPRFMPAPDSGFGGGGGLASSSGYAPYPSPLPGSGYSPYSQVGRGYV